MRAPLDLSEQRQMLSRVRGRQALERRLRGVLLSLHRYGIHRARSQADLLWTARAIDCVRQALDAPTDEKARP